MLSDLRERALQVQDAVSEGPLTSEHWRRLADMLSVHYPGGLMTVLEVDRADALVRRAFTSDVAAYPLDGTKRLMDTTWGRHVLDAGCCLIANTPEEMAAAFADHLTLSSLGYTKAMNIPMRRGDVVGWTVNLLRGGDTYSVSECVAAKDRIMEWVDEVYQDFRLTRSA
jgi:hypothetical protein